MLTQDWCFGSVGQFHPVAWEISQAKSIDCIMPVFGWAHFWKFIRLWSHSLGLLHKPFHFLIHKEGRRGTERGKVETANNIASFISLTTQTERPAHFASAHDSSFVFLMPFFFFFAAQEGPGPDEKLSLLDPMAAHSSWQPHAQAPLRQQQSCSNGLISILPRRSRWERRCAHRRPSHSSTGQHAQIPH